MDSPDSRHLVQGVVVKLQDVGGLHRHYERMAAYAEPIPSAKLLKYAFSGATGGTNATSERQKEGRGVHLI